MADSKSGSKTDIVMAAPLADILKASEVKEEKKQEPTPTAVAVAAAATPTPAAAAATPAPASASASAAQPAAAIAIDPAGSPSLQHIDPVEVQIFELDKTAQWADQRNNEYKALTNSNEFMEHHREWFDRFRPVKHRRYSKIDPPPAKSKALPDVVEGAFPANPKFLYFQYEAVPNEDLKDCLEYFVDMHTYGLIPVQWQFGCDTKTKMGKTLLRRSYLTGFLKKELVPLLTYLFGTHNEIDFWSAGSPFDMFFNAQPNAADNLAAVSQMDAVSSPIHQGIRGSSHCIQMKGTSPRQCVFPDWSPYVRLAHFLQNKNADLFMDICNNMVVVHFLDKQWRTSKSVFKAIAKIVKRVNDPKEAAPIRKAIREAHLDQLKYGLSQRILSLNGDYMSMTQLMSKPIEKLQMIYNDEAKRVHNNGLGKSRVLHALGSSVSGFLLTDSLAPIPEDG